ncbi:MAG: SprT-like domain-containing protein [Thermoflavifilum sp.]|nr:SprT-like domain-containing protein [Thermoflavifilum sp.]
MGKKVEVHLHTLAHYLPDGSFHRVLVYLEKYKVHLTITLPRQTVLGDYRHPDDYSGHRITVNGNLNRYEFLLTLLHELAHLMVFVQYGNRVEIHGREWQQMYAHLLREFIAMGIFPNDIQQVLQQYVHRPAATRAGERALARVLRKYSVRPSNKIFVEELEEGAYFTTEDGLIYQRGPKIRTRYRCMQLKTGREYLFHGLYEVKKCPPPGNLKDS